MRICEVSTRKLPNRKMRNSLLKMLTRAVNHLRDSWAAKMSQAARAEPGYDSLAESGGRAESGYDSLAESPCRSSASEASATQTCRSVSSLANRPLPPVPSERRDSDRGYQTQSGSLSDEDSQAAGAAAALAATAEPSVQPPRPQPRRSAVRVSHNDAASSSCGAAEAAEQLVADSEQDSAGRTWSEAAAVRAPQPRPRLSLARRSSETRGGDDASSLSGPAATAAAPPSSGRRRSARTASSTSTAAKTRSMSTWRL
ncbi:hypothetical protein BOX15_Mlig010841g2 [Macrostomum lignano]|uniref:Uncharacterized protein n=1 Tax=Macrostomum lignano TaxID=282301 RepID=A0A267DKU8_9PLAT|nr:hypothetical protein BOX15_Mlig010841g2 [Macrostomum lignano]